MKSHIRHTSQKSMGSRSASGRLLTIAFLCLFLTALVIAQSAFAGTLIVEIPFTDRSSGNIIVPVNASDDSILPEGTCDSFRSYNYTGPVKFDAVADAGWRFFQWTTTPPGLLIDATQSDPSAEIPIGPFDNITVTGHFIQTYQITSISGGTVSESDGTAIFTVTLDREPAVGDEVTVDYATGAVGDTATADSDYTITSGTLTFNNGTTASLTIPVPILNDTLVEPSESFTVTLSNPSVNATIADATATGTINDNDTAALTVADVAATEGGGLLFTVTLNNAVQGGFNVNVSLGGGSATGGGAPLSVPSDYDNVVSALTFAGNAGEPQTFTVATLDDAVVEGVETFGVSLAASTSLVDDSDTATGTINDNDTAALTVADVAATEGGGLLFTVTLNNAVQGGFNVNVSLGGGSATGGGAPLSVPSDYDNVVSALTFAGNAGEPQTFTVATLDDAVVEGVETFGVSLAASTSLVDDSDTATGTINDNDTAALTVADVAATEGGGLLFTVTLNNAVQGGFNVNVSLGGGSATGGGAPLSVPSDYDNVVSALTFAGNAGEPQTFTVATLDDAVVEGVETFGVSLAASTSLVDDSDTATGTINDNDTAALTVADVAATEGGGLLFTVTLNNAVQGGFNVNVSLGGGSATGGGAPLSVPSDYDNVVSALTFAGNAGEPQTFTVATLDDAVVEGVETFGVSLAASTSLVDDSDTATGTINDNDTAALTVADVAATEGGGLLFTVTLNNAVQGGFNVNVSLGGGSATGGGAPLSVPSDYDNVVSAVLM